MNRKTIDQVVLPKKDKLDEFAQKQIDLLETNKNDIASTKNIQDYLEKRRQKFGQKQNLNPKRVELKTNENSLLCPKKRDAKLDTK